MSDPVVVSAPESTGLSPMLKATAILGGSSLVSILLGLAMAKVSAVFLGPAGYGYLGLLQSMLGITVLVAGLGSGSGLVRMGAGLAARNERSAVANFWHGASLIRWAGSALVLIGFLVFRRTLSLWFLGTPDHQWGTVLVAVAVTLTLSAGLKTNIINMYHRVEALAKNGAIVALGGTVLSIALIAVWRQNGIVPSILATAAVTWLVAAYMLRKVVGPTPARPPLKETLQAAGSLLRFGGPYSASMMVGTCVQMALPILVLHTLGNDSVGYYRAAVGISVTYLGFLITAMAQDYFPRVSAVSDDPRCMCELINKQQRLVLVLGAPMILGTLALVPFLVPLVYSFRFTPTVEILEWQLIGDIFKFSSWTMSYAILASCSTGVYFLAELAGGVATLGATWLCIRLFGLAGLGISFVAAYVLYYLVVWAIARKQIGLRLTRSNQWLLILVACGGVLIRVVSYPPFKSMRTPAGLVLAAAAGIWSMATIAHETEALGRLAQVQRTLTRMRNFARSFLPET